MMKHTEFLWQSVNSHQGSSRQKEKEWQEIMGQLEKHLHLRAVSCCQVASKFISSQEAVNLSKAKAVLTEMGHSYSKNSIFVSEKRILRTLDYKLAFPCHYDYVLAILEAMDYNLRSEKLPLNRYLSVSAKLLKLLYLKADLIYDCFLDRISPHHHKSELKKVQVDKVLTAVVVITAAAYLSDPPRFSLVRTELQRLSQVPERNIKTFMEVLLVEVEAHGK